MRWTSSRKRQVHWSYTIFVSCLFSLPLLFIDNNTEVSAKPDVVNRMLYTNFDVHITDKYGIVCENWPLDKFCAPGDLSSRTEIQVLHQAWSNGIATFRRLTPRELDTWREGRNAPLATQAPAATQSSSPNVTFSETLEVASSASSSSASSSIDPSSIPIVPSSCSGVMAVSGQILVAKKPHKQRSDKGVPRVRRSAGRSTWWFFFVTIVIYLVMLLLSILVNVICCDHRKHQFEVVIILLSCHDS